jgi:hypothetical protein
MRTRDQVGAQSPETFSILRQARRKPPAAQTKSTLPSFFPSFLPSCLPSFRPSYSSSFLPSSQAFKEKILKESLRAHTQTNHRQQDSGSVEKSPALAKRSPLHHYHNGQLLKVLDSVVIFHHNGTPAGDGVVISICEANYALVDVEVEEPGLVTSDGIKFDTGTVLSIHPSFLNPHGIPY